MSETRAGGADPLGVDFATGRIGLKQVYDAHSGLVYSISRRALGEERAKDVTQEVFVSAWKARNLFDPHKGTLGAWLVGITKRKIIDHVRREQRHSDRRADDIGDVPSDSAIVEVERIADRVTLAHAVRQLPERPRRAISMAYVDGLTHIEIAERTGHPLGTVKSDIRRGLLMLRAQMERTHD